MRCRRRCNSSARRGSAVSRRWGTNCGRPEADYLRYGIYELRASYQGVHYRVLYFFAGKAVVVLSHGTTKEDRVPNREIDRAIERKEQVGRDFERYTFRPD
jgi:phage-related protein